MLLALTATGTLLAYQAFTTGPLAGMGGDIGMGADGMALSLAACTALGGGGGGAVAFRRLPLDSLSHEQPAAAGGTAGGARMVRFDNLAYTEPVHKVGGVKAKGCAWEVALCFVLRGCWSCGALPRCGMPKSRQVAKAGAESFQQRQGVS